MANATMIVRESGCVAGLVALDRVVNAYDASVTLKFFQKDGDIVQVGQTLATLQGSLASILMIERVALNLVSHLSGIATLTRRYVDAIATVPGACAKIYDTRKTLPGWRGLQKYAVACGGGATHRSGLYDAMLIKDNHIAHLQATSLASAVDQAARQARQQYPDLQFVQVEVDTLEQLAEVLTTSVDIVLLDNMPSDTLRQAVTMRDQTASHIKLEASGGVNLKTVAAIASTGVDRISVGALTHSPRALDIGLDIQPETTLSESKP